MLVVPDNWLYKHSLVEKPGISPGFLSGSAGASDGNLALHRRPRVLENSKNVTGLGMFNLLCIIFASFMTFTVDKEHF